jgi:hypothetical protein
MPDSSSTILADFSTAAWDEIAGGRSRLEKGDSDGYRTGFGLLPPTAGHAHLRPFSGMSTMQHAWVAQLLSVGLLQPDL